jgi:murein DD-endopeptidase MepM/ murein hydrolase activator NlpD
MASAVVLEGPAVLLCDTSADAVYTVEYGALHPARGLFSLYPPGLAPLAPRVAAPEESAPGSLLRLSVSSADALDSVVLSLRATDGREMARATCFRIAADGGRETWAVLLGIPSDAVRPSAVLAMRITAGSRSCVYLQPVSLVPRHFFSERMELSKDLTQLVAVPDSKKNAESRMLSRILFTADSDATFETGALSVPIPNARRSSGYGDRREYDYADKTSDRSIHQGVDLAAPSGSDVPACGRGRVVFSGLRILTGNSVVIEHLPGVFSLYYHMSSLQVGVGDIVEKGQVIGKVGMTGFATGPHLHWEVRVMGTAVDPDLLTDAPLLDKEPVFKDIEGRERAEGR